MKKFFTYVKLTIGTLVITGLFIVLPVLLVGFGIIAAAWVISVLLLVDSDD
tara:strand:+ start:734 stop:886 length:153 start_codon:yes stop_codon:yes gene_type:complete